MNRERVSLLLSLLRTASLLAVALFLILVLLPAAVAAQRLHPG